MSTTPVEPGRPSQTGLGVQQHDNHPHPKKELRSIEPCSKVDEIRIDAHVHAPTMTVGYQHNRLLE